METGRTYFIQEGKRYRLGYDNFKYFIWDKNAPSEASAIVITYPKTPEGWQAVVDHFKHLENVENHKNLVQNSGVFYPEIPQQSLGQQPGVSQPNSETITAPVNLGRESEPPVGAGQMPPYNIYPAGGYFSPGFNNFGQNFAAQEDLHINLIRKLANSSFYFGLVSILTFPIGFLLGIPSVIAIATGVIALSEIKKFPPALVLKSKAVTGVVLGIVSFLGLIALTAVAYSKLHSPSGL